MATLGTYRSTSRPVGKSTAGQPSLLTPGTSRSSKYSLPTATEWNFKTSPMIADLKVAAACGVSPVTAAILRTRGYSTPQAVSQFLVPAATGLRDPLLLPDIGPALRRLHTAINDQEPFLIFGDYDVDGVTSTALLWRAFNALGAKVRAQIPERHEGYGLSVAAVEKAAEAGIGLILTADNGVRALEAVARARELGVEVIITDHHEPGPELPDALAVINPKREDSQYGFRELCGCGVAFKVLQALMQEYWPRHADSFQAKFVELAALATVADCVPLIDENRILAREGLRRLASTNKLGLQALIQGTRLKITGDRLCGRHVSFTLAPRLNAAGRLDSPQKSLRLLMSTDSAECESLAAELEEFNRLRQEATHRILSEALEIINEQADLKSHCALVVAKEGWNKGVVGLVASRLVESFARPVIVLDVHDGVAHGSGRSIDKFDLSPMLEATRDLLLSGGGHQAACGLSLESHRVDHFRERVLEYAGQQLQVDSLVSSVEADCLVAGGDLTEQLATDLDKLEPCGTGNSQALLMIKEARLVDGRALGAGNEHLKWRVESDGRFFEAVWWRPGEKANGFKIGQYVDLCFVPELNHWNGNTKLQLIIKEARAS
ncbi:MAG: single-stranded-DNA-specific exonuclease RecJ [Abitibacteriaceae bacterium]|nr:single-stranded-DNA-specific exonuclease RecJ [Abditibacteriaceae bacterium]MBV9866197.1 single-stranded-DNA-specific exonuclease RecJ [Abditibacteriaceae bacterium]